MTKLTRHQIDAYTLARAIADNLDHEENIGIDILFIMADVLADQFEFSDEERDSFVAEAMANHPEYFARMYKFRSNAVRERHLKVVPRAED
jgi:hypothetical protein